MGTYTGDQSPLSGPAKALFTLQPVDPALARAETTFFQLLPGLLGFFLQGAARKSLPIAGWIQYFSLPYPSFQKKTPMESSNTTWPPWKGERSFLFLDTQTRLRIPGFQGTTGSGARYTVTGFLSLKPLNLKLWAIPYLALWTDGFSFWLIFEGIYYTSFYIHKDRSFCLWV